MPPADSTSNSTSALPPEVPPAQALVLPPALEAALANGSVLIAPSAAAARQVREAFNSVQRARGLLAWEPAPVISWSQWLDSLWSDALLSGFETRLLLNEIQEHSLWADIVLKAPQPSTRQPGSKKPAADSGDTPEAPLTSADALATLARNAWNLAASYNAVSRLRASADTHDARTFALWAERFGRECERNSLLPRAALEAALQAHVDGGTFSASPRLDFAGFGELNPAQQNLLDAFRNAGTAIVLHKTALSSHPSGERKILCAESEPNELYALARWIRDFIEQRQAAGETARVGVFLPDLDDDRAAFEAVFLEILAPELQPIDRDLSSTPYEFAAGQPLASMPLVAVALDLLRWLDGDLLPLGNVSALLLSPYLGIQDPGTAASLNESAQFDAWSLRQLKLLRPEIGLSALHALARKSPYGKAPLTWLEPLNHFVNNATRLRSPSDFAGWAEFFRSLVHSTGWPGQRPLTRIEFHITRAWDDALDALATLDFMGNKATLRDALRALERQLAGTAFTPPPTGATVQIMGLASATGLTFDALVLARATDTNFPPPERTNPLLSFGLQASLDMPGANAARAAERARDLLDKLLKAAPNVLFTYAKESSDGEQRLAPLPAGLQWPVQDASALLPQAFGAVVAEEVVEDAAMLPALPSPLVHGGARVLQLQAACGFAAFAEMRLRSSQLDVSDLGFNAMESGSRLHDVMERFWKEVPSQEELRKFSKEQRKELLSACIAASFSEKVDVEDEWDEAYVAVQKDRMLLLLESWLETELKRGPFRVVDSETQQLLHVGPLELSVRLDRMDAVDGGFFLVDYKTGSAPALKGWEGQRPDDPQLPLYALLDHEGELKGMAFAKVRAGKEMKWLGYQSELGLIPGKKVTNLNQTIAEWRSTLTSLAEAFARGDASVNPKEYPHTCEYCGQRLLCRLDSVSLLAAGGDDTDEDADSGEDGHDG